MKLPILSRRAALQGLSVSFAAAFTPQPLSAAGSARPARRRHHSARRA